jgi:hypothetical protein
LCNITPNEEPTFAQSNNLKTLKVKNMKKLILVLAAIGFITMAATTKMSSSIDKAFVKSELSNEKYKACIAACNEAIEACNKCETKCSKDKDAKMSLCTQLCKDCITACKAANKAMTANSANAKSECTECAKACEKCATECDKYTTDHCKKCATDCRKAAKLCSEM